jgi:GlpG protein
MKQAYPVLTLVSCAICVVVFIGLLNEPNASSWEALAKWGCYPPDKIHAGALWGFITSTFVHLELWHVAFNLYWLYVLGSRLERVIGSGRWLAFFLGAAFVSSGAEFAVAGTTGIGASGVAYALFGFMWVTRRRHPTFGAVLDARTIGLFFLWLVGCLIMTLTKTWEVGNAAHVAGLFFGAGLGAWMICERRRRLIKLGLAALFLMSIVPVFWAPWSFDWASWRGTRAYERGDYRSAIRWYERSSSLGQDKIWCWQSIAIAYYAMGDQTHYERTLQLLRNLDEKAAKKVEADVRPEKK